MKVVKIKSDKTYKNKEGKERPIYYYAIEDDNGKLTPIKPMYNDGYPRLDYISQYKK